MMSGMSLETFWAIKKHCNNKFYYTVASSPLSHDSCRQPQTYVKPEAAITVFELLMMSGVSLETFWAIKKHWNNKFYYTVASSPLSHDSCRQPQTYVKTEAEITVFELLMMSSVSLETFWAIKKHWNNKFYYTVASSPLSHDSCRQPQTYVKTEAEITVFELLMMRSVSLETFWAIKKHWNNKFYYTVASCWLFLYDLYYDTRIHEHQVCNMSCSFFFCEKFNVQNKSCRPI